MPCVGVGSPRSANSSARRRPVHDGAASDLPIGLVALHCSLGATRARPVSPPDQPSMLPLQTVGR
jgi:hypothetical protein